MHHTLIPKFLYLPNVSNFVAYVFLGRPSQRRSGFQFKMRRARPFEGNDAMCRAKFIQIPIFVVEKQLPTARAIEGFEAQRTTLPLGTQNGLHLNVLVVSCWHFGPLSGHDSTCAFVFVAMVFGTGPSC